MSDILPGRLLPLCLFTSACSFVPGAIIAALVINGIQPCERDHKEKQRIRRGARNIILHTGVLVGVIGGFLTYISEAGPEPAQALASFLTNAQTNRWLRILITAPLCFVGGAGIAAFVIHRLQAFTTVVGERRDIIVLTAILVGVIGGWILSMALGGLQ